MNEIKKLTALELRSYYGINTFRHSKDKKYKRRYRILAAAWIYVGLAVMAYVGFLVRGFCRGGLVEIVPTYLTVIASIIGLLFGIFKAGHVIFGARGCDILFSLPVKRSSVVISRFVGMYLEDLIFALVVMIPGIAVSEYYASLSYEFYGTLLVGLFFIPMIPLSLATLIGAFISAATGKMRNKAVVQTALSVCFVVLYMLVYYNALDSFENLTDEAFMNFVATMNDMLARIYPPAAWVASSASGNLLYLGLFAVVSLAALVAVISLVSASFEKIQRRIASGAAKKNYKMKEMRASHLSSALLRREAKRYFASPVYVTNTVIGPIMGVLAAAALLVMGQEKLAAYLSLGFDIEPILPFGIAGIFTTMTVTSVSISMEGKHFWLIKSMPVSAKALFDSKILFNLLLVAPFYLVAEVLFFIALKPSAMAALWIVLIPAATILFTVVFGISANIKFCRFDWVNEATIVKQSASAAIGGFAGGVLSILFGLATFYAPDALTPYVNPSALVILVGLTVFFYNWNNKTKLEKL